MSSNVKEEENIEINNSGEILSNLDVENQQQLEQEQVQQQEQEEDDNDNDDDDEYANELIGSKALEDASSPEFKRSFMLASGTSLRDVTSFKKDNVDDDNDSDKNEGEKKQQQDEEEEDGNDGDGEMIDHFRKLRMQRQASVRYMEKQLSLRSTMRKSTFLEEEEEEEEKNKDGKKDKDDNDEGFISKELTKEQKNQIIQDTAYLKEIEKYFNEYHEKFPSSYNEREDIEVRINNLTYEAEINISDGGDSNSQIKTVYNQSFWYDIVQLYYRMFNKDKYIIKKKTKKIILNKINLILKPKKTYLILGPPSSGKTSLLKAISGRLSKDNLAKVSSGYIQYNGLEINGSKLLKDTFMSLGKEKIYIDNAISYVEQIDRHAPRLTVNDTFTFAFNCKCPNGSHNVYKSYKDLTDEQKNFIKKLDDEKKRINMITNGLGLSHVSNTFVGDNDVRGISGGQRRRVTCGEMIMSPYASILCGDELSTGLDASSTYDIINIFSHTARLTKKTQIISLLQPSPEVVSLFDGIILLAEGGQIIYSGSLRDVENYFALLGYKAPTNMDIADFLQNLTNYQDSKELFHPPSTSIRKEPFTINELSDAFRCSPLGIQITNDLQKPWKHNWKKNLDVRNSTEGSGSGMGSMGSRGSKAIKSVLRSTSLNNNNDNDDPNVWNIPTPLKRRYANNTIKSIQLNIQRNITLWLRDKRFLIANGIKNLIMGVSVGGVFYQTDIVASIYGVLFQLNLFIMLGSMTSAPGLLDDRIIFYRHRDSNFYTSLQYTLGKTISSIPQSIIDVTIFGTIIYFMVGLVINVKNFFIYYGILCLFTLVMNQTLSIFASISTTKSSVQALSAVVLLFCVLFCGFIIAPIIIPPWFIWIYWLNPLAWAYRSLLINEFISEKYDDLLCNTCTFTVGQANLISFGFIQGYEDDGITPIPFNKLWISYGYYFLLGFFIIAIILTCIGYYAVRAEGNASGSSSSTVLSGNDNNPNSNDDGDEEQQGDGGNNGGISIPFQHVNLSFENITYDVVSSINKKESIRLLNNVNGIFKSGRMCALMGESGAGKTTLMDVIALRKSSGEVGGEILINGYPQNIKSWKRYSGYVEQFDVQASELTVRETILFSAMLRLDKKKEATNTNEKKTSYADMVIDMLELTSIKDCIVGNDEEGGLSFEQRKRLSIAVELAASPSILFLDEPTSGLDARAALLVATILRKISDTGRTVIATIHQPSLAVFSMFDDLLLLKKGGKVVFYGELGVDCCNLIQYFESNGARSIHCGENPANWMLSVMSDSGTNRDGTPIVIDYSGVYINSGNKDKVVDEIHEIKANRTPDNEVTFEKEFAAPPKTRRLLLAKRLQLIYWRSPAYNLGRMLIAAVIAIVFGLNFLGDERNPNPSSESQMNSALATIFISFIIMGVLAITAVLPVMLNIRDVFYRHQAAGMLTYPSLAIGLAVAEKWFILATGGIFCIIFIPLSGITYAGGEHLRWLGYWGFFTFNLAIYSYFGQCFMCAVRGMSTAQILASVFIGINNFFSGYIVRPQYLTSIFSFTYWICPGHYIYEGLVLSTYDGDDRIVIPSAGSDFESYLLENDICTDDQISNDTCQGNVEDYIRFFFGNKFAINDNYRIYVDAIVCGFILVLARLGTFFALKYCRYTSS